ncbi:PKD domain-containing protein [Pleionea sp. CnH1-48]|uniref:PKD domain-containing protein n=1 Tax=Pleionea sp. CnH1-48 TaxID=2954494 RepID=UPI00209769EF|nr:PKD domain-containing protein [Pleionea sp. CnH1-48]MCO7224224.1 PKD domain-containing protein [Pleionea sp. CnH1-48]
MPSTTKKLLSALLLTTALTACDIQGPDEMVAEFNTQRNQAPTAVTSAAARIEVGTTTILDGSQSSDSDGSIASYAWSQTEGPTVTLTTPNEVRTEFTAPSVNAATTLTFLLTVTDNEGATGTATASVIVEPMMVNRAPVANAGLDFTASIVSEVTLDGSSSSDPDGDAITYLWTSQDSSITLNNATQAVANFIAPTVNAATDYTFTLTVRDPDGLTGSDDVVITVDPQSNMVPVADAGQDQMVSGTDEVFLVGTGSNDPDGNIISYLWEQTQGTTVTIQSANAATARFTAPDVTANEDLIFRLTVRDNNNAIASDTVTINVEPLNNMAPVANAGPDQTVDGYSTVTLDGSQSSDSDGFINDYQWTQLSGTNVTINGNGTANPTFKAPNEDEVLQFRLTAIDDRGAGNSDEVDITVNAIQISGSCSTHPGRAQWVTTCAGCHGTNNDGGSRAGADLNILINNSTMADNNDIAGLVAYVAANMPPGNGTCTGTCAYDTSSFILSIFNNECTVP